MVSVFSNTKTEPACLISKLKFNNDNNVDNIQFQRLGWLLPQRGKYTAGRIQLHSTHI